MYSLTMPENLVYQQKRLTNKQFKKYNIISNSF